MIYRRGQKVLVHGITGKQGTFWAEKMMECGTRSRGRRQSKTRGRDASWRAGFRPAVEAMAQTPYDVSVIFIPPLMAKDATIDAIDAGVKTHRHF